MVFIDAMAFALDRAGIQAIKYHGGLNVRQRDQVIRKFNVPHAVPAPEAAPAADGAAAPETSGTDIAAPTATSQAEKPAAEAVIKLTVETLLMRRQLAGAY